MFIDNTENLEKGDIRAFYLLSDVEIVGEVVRVTDTHVILNRPFKVMLIQSGPAYFPFSFCVEADNRIDCHIPISKSAIAAQYECAEHIITEYTRLVTGIEIAQPGSDLSAAVSASRGV
jgi:hypothetical protein